MKHKNRNGLDNQRDNLRYATRSQQSANTARKPNPSGFRGVRFTRNRFHAQICVNKRSIHLGYFDTADQAAKAYDEAALRFQGGFAVLNFPEEVTL